MQGSNIYFFGHGHVAYQMKRDDLYNRIQVKCSPYHLTGNLWVGTKGQIQLDFFKGVGISNGPP